MATVPAVPTPNALQAPAAPNQNVQAPQGAFLAGVLGEAATKMGVTAEKASDMLASHAEAIQGLTNKATADQYSQLALQEQSQYSDKFQETHRGIKATPEALAKAQADLEEIRQKHRENLTNPMAQAIYDADTRRTTGFQIVDLGHYVATTAKQAVRDSMNAREEMAVSHAINSGNQQEWDAALNIIHQNSKLAGQIEGLDEKGVELYDLKRTSEAWKGYLDHMSLTDAPGAQKVFDKIRGQMTPDQANAMGDRLHRMALPQESAAYTAGMFDHNAGTALLPGGTLNGGKFFDTWWVQHEGTAQVTDVNGHQVKFGINEKANPEFFHNGVGGTQEEAKQIFLTKYFKGDLPAPLAAAYADSKGLGLPVDKMLKESGGDVNKFLDLREQWMKADVARNPALQKYAHAWNTRNADLRQYVQSAGTAAPNVETIDGLNIFEGQGLAQIHSNFSQDPVAMEAHERDFSQEVARRRQLLGVQEKQARGIIDTALVGGPNGDQPRPMSMAQLMTIPGVADAMDKVSEEDRAAFARRIDENFAPSMARATPEALHSYTLLYGLSKQDPVAFANINMWTDPRTAGMPATLRVQLEKLQQTPEKPNPTYHFAMGIAGNYLAQAGKAFKDPTSPASTYFAASMSSRVDAYLAINKGKPPDRETVLRWTSEMLMEYAQGREASMSNLVSGVPNAEAEAIVNELRRRGRTTHNSDILRMYTDRLAQNGGG